VFKAPPSLLFLQGLQTSHGARYMGLTPRSGYNHQIEETTRAPGVFVPFTLANQKSTPVRLKTACIHKYFIRFTHRTPYDAVDSLCSPRLPYTPQSPLWEARRHQPDIKAPGLSNSQNLPFTTPSIPLALMVPVCPPDHRCRSLQIPATEALRGLSAALAHPLADAR
jgi:hypothetical protein